MQYTDHYNLNLPEGTDIVNPLVQDNPNYTAIDSALYANKLRGIGTATELTTGTVHALTRADQDIAAFKFVATSDYNAGDTFTIDGVSVTARIANGKTPANKAYLINSTVLCELNGTVLNILNVESNTDASDVVLSDGNNLEDAISEYLKPLYSGKLLTYYGIAVTSGAFLVLLPPGLVEEGSPVSVVSTRIVEIAVGGRSYSSFTFDDNGLLVNVLDNNLTPGHAIRFQATITW